MGYFSVLTPRQHDSHWDESVQETSQAELTPHKLAPFHFPISSVSQSFMYTFLPTSTTCNPRKLSSH